MVDQHGKSKEDKPIPVDATGVINCGWQKKNTASQNK